MASFRLTTNKAPVFSTIRQSIILLLACIAVCLATPSGRAYAIQTVIPNPGPSQWTRIWGQDRFETMRSIVTKAFDKADTVVIATGKDFPDALTASSLAGCCSAPIILVGASGIDSSTLQMVKGLGAKNAYIIGKTGAVPAGVDVALKGIGVSVTRLGGGDRFETARLVDAEALKLAAQNGKKPDTAIVCLGTKFPDALSISPYAYAEGCPIYLATGDKVLDPQMVAAIQAGGFSRIVLVGAEGAVSDDVKSQLGSAFEYVRLGGSNRYETSNTVAAWAVKSGVLSYEDMAIATGTDFADALSGAAMCGKSASVIVLTDGSDTELAEICVNQKGPKIKQGWVLGGTSAITDEAAGFIEESANVTRYSGQYVQTYVCGECGMWAWDKAALDRHIKYELTNKSSMGYETPMRHYYIPDEAVTSTQFSVLWAHVAADTDGTYRAFVIYKCSKCGYTGYAYFSKMNMPASTYNQGVAARRKWIEQNCSITHDCKAYWILANRCTLYAYTCGCGHITDDPEQHGFFEMDFNTSFYNDNCFHWASGCISEEEFYSCTQGKCSHIARELTYPE